MDQGVVSNVGSLSDAVHCAGMHSHRPLKVLDVGKFEEVQRINSTASMMLAKGFRQKGCCAPGASIVCCCHPWLDLLGSRVSRRTRLARPLCSVSHAV